MPEEASTFLIITAVVCGGTGLAAFMLWNYVSGKTLYEWDIASRDGQSVVGEVVHAAPPEDGWL